VAPADEVPARDFYQRLHPTMLARLRLRLIDRLLAVLGTSFTESWVQFAPRSTLARDLASNDPRVRRLLVVDRRVGVHLIELGLAYDRRDDEQAPTRGQWHTIKLLLSPGRLQGLPHRYLEINVVARGYVTVWPGRLVLAARLLGDAQLGDVPFFALSRYYPEDTSAVGGANGVRGIPGERYRGKWKALANLEARSTLFHLQVHGSAYAVGVVGFFDTGRVWSDLPADPALDGRGLGLKYGVGGGLRVEKGQTFVIRADLAWSPDARPIGGYLIAGHMF
jgi:outer membrane protein assembly factor BamA